MIGGPGGDLLFRRLSGSTIGAEGFHGRVRDGIGCLAPRYGHQAGQAPRRWVMRRGEVSSGEAARRPGLADRVLALGAAMVSGGTMLLAQLAAPVAAVQRWCTGFRRDAS